MNLSETIDIKREKDMSHKQHIEKKYMFRNTVTREFRQHNINNIFYSRGQRICKECIIN